MVDHFQDVVWQLRDKIRNNVVLVYSARKVSKSISACSRYGFDLSYPKDRSSSLIVEFTLLDGFLLFVRRSISRDRAGWIYFVSSYCSHLLMGLILWSAKYQMTRNLRQDIRNVSPTRAAMAALASELGEQG